MPDDVRTPALADENLLAAPPMSALVPMTSMPLALQIFFDDRLFERCQMIAAYLSRAAGFAPRHLIGNKEACFAVVSRSLTWKMDPYAVAQATYQTPGGQVGYFGSLCQAIIEQSGRLQGGVKFTHFGDWSKVQRKYKLVKGEKDGRKYEFPAPAWQEADEEGLGVTVSAQVKDEAEPRELEFFLRQAYPRNSTLWATDPMTQIKYTAVRRFATSVAPSLFMGVPFSGDEVDEWAETLKDVTPVPAPPRPRIEDTDRRVPRRASPVTDIETERGETQQHSPAGDIPSSEGKEDRSQPDDDRQEPAGETHIEETTEEVIDTSSFMILTADGEFIECATVEDLRDKWNALFQEPMSPDQIIGMWNDNGAVRERIYTTFGSAAMDPSFKRFKQAEHDKRQSQPGLLPGIGSAPGAPSDDLITIRADDGWGDRKLASEFRAKLTEITNLAPELRKSAIERFRQINGRHEMRLNTSQQAWMKQNIYPVYEQYGVRV